MKKRLPQRLRVDVLDVDPIRTFYRQLLRPPLGVLDLPEKVPRG
ncbi:MAG TPA: hypothetical protein VFL41_04885 [Gaiellaceae bacterium]|nr:hypothetical protein [Gaiellaceae bacterium]